MIITVLVLNPPSDELYDLAAVFDETLGEGRTVSIVESARSLASRMARQTPELVVLDYRLGDGNEEGGAILERLSKRHNRVPFVAEQHADPRRSQPHAHRRRIRTSVGGQETLRIALHVLSRFTKRSSEKRPPPKSTSATKMSM